MHQQLSFIPTYAFVNDFIFKFSVSYDKDFICAATSDPSNVNRLGTNEVEGLERLFLIDIKKKSTKLIIEVPVFVSILKLVYPSFVICGHFDGNVTVWSLENEGEFGFAGSNRVNLKGHTADVLSLDVNQVSDF